MGIFSSKPYDPNEVLLKQEMKRQLTKAELKTIRKAASRGKFKNKIRSGAGAVIVNATGKIMDLGPFQKVSLAKERIKNTQCPGCGKGMPRKGFMCPSCAKGMGAEINYVRDTNGLGKGIPDGQNLNGIVYCVNNHRAMFYEVEGKWNCSSGCNG